MRVLGIGGFRVTCSNRNLEVAIARRKDCRVKPPVDWWRTIARRPCDCKEEAHWLMNSCIPRSAKTVREVRESAQPAQRHDRACGARMLTDWKYIYVATLLGWHLLVLFRSQLMLPPQELSVL